MTDSHPAKTAAQRRVLDEIGCGNHSPMMSKATVRAMLRDGLIYELPSRREAIGHGLTLTIRQFEMPTAIHIAWCEAMSAQHKEGQDD